MKGTEFHDWLSNGASLEVMESRIAGDCHFLGALIGGAVSLFGGLMGKSDAEKQDRARAKAAKVPVVTDTSHEVDLNALNKAAIAAGYNPMTILNAGGLSAFTKTHTETTGQNAMAAVPTAPSFGSVLANAASSAFNTYRDDKAAAAQAAAISSSSFPPAPTGIMSVLGNTPGGGRSGGKGLQFAAAPTLTSKKGDPIAPTFEKPTVTNPYEWFKVDPTVRDAEMDETRSGDIVSNITGAYVKAQDFLYNWTGRNSVERYEDYSFKGMRERARAGLLTESKTAADALAKASTYLPSSWFVPAKKPALATGGGGAW